MAVGDNHKKNPPKPVQVKKQLNIDDLDKAQIVPVSQTHRVTTSKGEIASAEERAKEERMERLRNAEDELLSESMQVIAGAVKFAEIEGEDAAMDGDFLERYRDHPDPEKLHRIMRAANKASKDAPVGLAIAQKTMVGIIKARATEKQTPQQLNVAVQVVTQLPEFKVIDVE